MSVDARLSLCYPVNGYVFGYSREDHSMTLYNVTQESILPVAMTKIPNDIEVDTMQYHFALRKLILNKGNDAIDLSEWLSKYHPFFDSLLFTLPAFKDGALRNLRNLTVIIQEDWQAVTNSHLMIGYSEDQAVDVTYTIKSSNMNGCGLLRLFDADFIDVGG